MLPAHPVPPHSLCGSEVPAGEAGSLLRVTHTSEPEVLAKPRSPGPWDCRTEAPLVLLAVGQGHS